MSKLLFKRQICRKSFLHNADAFALVQPFLRWNFPETTVAWQARCIGTASCPLALDPQLSLSKLIL